MTVESIISMKKAKAMMSGMLFMTTGSAAGEGIGAAEPH